MEWCNLSDMPCCYVTEDDMIRRIKKSIKKMIYKNNISLFLVMVVFKMNI